MERNESLSPVKSSERFVILDALRGFALLGICMANFPEFALYSFLDSGVKESMATFQLDRLTQWLLYFLIEGKFYTIFSLLFGIGFSIIIGNCARRGKNGMHVFYRRMIILLLIGFAHLMLVWSGDILMLYALVGMTLPLFTRLSDKALLWWALVFLFLPVVVDTVCEIAGVTLSGWLVGKQWEYCSRYGITEANFAYWLRDSQSYGDVLKFLVQGAWERMSEFVDGNRYFKVLGLFLIGFYLGRNRMFARLRELSGRLKRLTSICLLIGLPLSACYAWSAMTSHPLGNGVHSLLYFLSVYLTSFGYIGAICLLYLHFENAGIWKALAAPGKMALTNYIGQSFIGMLIFYGTGFGLGASFGLAYVELTVLVVFMFEMLFSMGWLIVFRFGPLEWIWRCLTYEKIFPFMKEKP